MRRLLALTMLALVIGPLTAVRADQAPTISGKPDAAEAAFVRAIQADLPKRFSTPAAAERAGYFRYTNEDDTGAISYANLAWESADAKHPSQLWYDVHGHLLGADFSTLERRANSARPRKWGIQPGRWTEIDAHIHYVAKDPATGKLLYDKYVTIAPWTKGGGDPIHPKAETLVSLGLVKRRADVVTVFLFPSIWDLIVWVKPNPAGAFADKNPLVTPSSP
jgi:hypothetical protein